MCLSCISSLWKLSGKNTFVFAFGRIRPLMHEIHDKIDRLAAVYEHHAIIVGIYKIMPQFNPFNYHYIRWPLNQKPMAL
jgi:hypothetical protein